MTEKSDLPQISTSTYYEIDSSFRMALLGGEPRGWRKATTAEEEVLETCLCLFTRELTGLPLDVFCRSGEYWGIQDLVAIDPVGRFHLFEIKKGKVGEGDARQLHAYLLQFVFRDAPDFYEEWREKYSTELLGERLAVYLAGVLCGKRTTVRGYKYLRRTLGDGLMLRERDYVRLDRPAKQGKLLEALLLDAQGRRSLSKDSLPTADSLRSMARSTTEQITSRLPVTLPSVRVPRRAVIWLVGQDFHAAALQQVRRWRSIGIDARFLVAEVRLARSEPRMWVRVAHEIADVRDGVERSLYDRWRRLPPNVEMKFRFYRELPPSAQREDGGGLLEHNEARVMVRSGPHDEFVTLDEYLERGIVPA